jgi:hypothetical protein
MVPISPEPSPPPRRLHLWTRLLLGAGALLALLAVSLYLAVDWRGKVLWEEHLAEMETAGRTLDPERLFTPAHEGTFWGNPAVRAMAETEVDHKRLDEIFATDPELDEGTYRAELGEFASRFHLDHGEAPSLNRFFPGADLPSQEAAARLLSLLDEFEGELTSLRSALLGAPSSVLREGEKLHSCNFGPVGSSLAFSRAANLRALCLVEIGLAEEALVEIEDLLRLHRHLRHEGLLIHELMAGALITQPLRSLHRGLDRSAWKPKQLEALNRQLEEALPNRGEFDRLLQREFCFQEAFFSEHLARRGQRSIYGMFSGDLPESILRPDWIPEWAEKAFKAIDSLIWQSLPNGAFRLPTIEMHRWAFGSLLSPEIALADRVGDEAQLPSVDEAAWFRNPAAEFVFQSASTFKNVLRRQEETRILLEMALVAVAAEQHRLSTGRHPANWDEIVPRWLAAIPVDPWTGGPLRYVLDEEGRPVIYSVGGNGTDEGGTPGESWDEDDFVWRYSTAPGTKKP